jgi:hypothetical protein
MVSAGSLDAAATAKAITQLQAALDRACPATPGGDDRLLSIFFDTLDSIAEQFPAAQSEALTRAAEEGWEAVDRASQRRSVELIGWSGDGRLVLMETKDGPLSDSTPQLRLMVKPLSGGLEQAVCSLPANLAEIDWAPDLSRLALVTMKKYPTVTESGAAGPSHREFTLTIQDLRSGAEVLVGSGVCPHWSPDGKRLLYADPQQEDLESSKWAVTRQNVWLVDAQGRYRRLIAKALLNQPNFVAWSPDSRHVAYSVLYRTPGPR